MKRVSVQFIKSWRNYVSGDRAGFIPNKNGTIEPIEEGVAVLAESGKQETLVTRAAPKPKAEKPSDLRDELEALSYPKLKSRAHQVANDYGEHLSSLDSLNTESLIAFIIGCEG